MMNIMVIDGYVIYFFSLTIFAAFLLVLALINDFVEKKIKKNLTRNVSDEVKEVKSVRENDVHSSNLSVVSLNLNVFPAFGEPPSLITNYSYPIMINGGSKFE
jgi:hypothetical protein